MLQAIKDALSAIQAKVLKDGALPVTDKTHYMDPAEFNTLLDTAKATVNDVEVVTNDVTSLKSSRTTDEAVQANLQTSVNVNTNEINSLKNSRTQDEAAIAELPGFYQVGLGIDPNTLNIPSNYVFADDGTNLWVRRKGETTWSTRAGGAANPGTLAFNGQPQLASTSVKADGWSTRFLYQDAGGVVTIEQQFINGGPWVAGAPSWIDNAWRIDVTGQPAGVYQHRLRITEGVNTVVSNPVSVDISAPTSTVMATTVTSSQATFAGTPTLPTQGQVQKYRVAYQLIGTDASPDAAVAAGRYIDITTAGDIAAFAGGGVTKALALAGGSQYTFSIQTTILCGDGIGMVTGNWVAGNTATVDDLPTASNVFMDSGPYAIGANIPGHYIYGDLDGQPENGTTFKHYRGAKNDGSDKLVIAGATTLDYIAQSADGGQYVFLGVTPKDASGIGLEVISTPVAVAPPVLTGLSATTSSGQNVLSCGAGTPGSTINLYRSTVPGVTKQNGIKISNVVLPYTDPQLVNGQTYYYVITQVGPNGLESAESAEVSVTTGYIIDLFNNSSLDSTKFVTSTNSNGSVVEGTNGLTINVGAGVASAAIVCGKNSFPVGTVKTIKNRFTVPNINYGLRLLAIMKGTTVPVVGNSGTVFSVANRLACVVLNSNGTVRAWINASDGNHLQDVPFLANTEYDAVIEMTATQVRARVLQLDGTEIATTGWVDTASVTSSGTAGNLWVMFGDEAIDYNENQSAKFTRYAETV